MLLGENAGVHGCRATAALCIVALAALAAAGAAAEDLRFMSADGVELAGTLVLPAGPAPHPGLVFVQGRSYGGREQFLEHAERAAGRGVAGLVFDGRGVGESGGERGRHTLEDRLADVEAALDALRRHPGIDPDRVGLFGHSAGGWVVPVVAQRRPPVAFLVLHAGPAVSLAEQQAEVVRRLMERSGRDFRPADYEAAASYQRRLVARAGAGEVWSDLAPLVESVAGRPWAEFVDRPDSGDHPELDYFRRNPHDSRAALRATRIPLLALYGADDWIVPPEVNRPALEEALTAAGNDRFEIVVFAGADHGLEVPGQGHPPGYWQTLLDWLGAQAGIRP